MWLSIVQQLKMDPIDENLKKTKNAKEFTARFQVIIRYRALEKETNHWSSRADQIAEKSFAVAAKYVA